jgi:outer membrane protein assembly factor BamD
MKGWSAGVTKRWGGGLIHYCIAPDFLQPAQLDGAENFITLRSPMKLRILASFFCLTLGLFFSQWSGAAVVFKPGEKAKYVPPGEEEMNGNAEELFHIGQVAEQEGNSKRAIKAYKTLVRRHPKDALAASALYRAGVLTEKANDLYGAADLFRRLVERYPSSPHFDEAIEGQFRVGEAYLAGKKVKLLGIPIATSADRAVEIFAAVIRTAPYGKYTARAQFDIGLGREKQHLNDAALQAYQAVVDKFPDDSLAADAQYQIGYIWWMAAKQGTRDLAATKNARTAFQDFLFRYPNSEKAPQARANLQLLENKQTASAFNVAKFYDKQKQYRAAVIYYNEVIREQPGSVESERAKKRIDQLRAKLGDAVMDAVPPESQKKPPQTAKHEPPMSAPSDNSSGPLPPPETDLSLPPPASLSPNTTTAPEPLPNVGTTSPSEGSPPPETSASPGAAASPAP